MASNKSTLAPREKTTFSDLLFFPRLATSGNVLYGIASTLETENSLIIFCLSENGNTLVPIQETPAFGRHLRIETSETELQKALKDNIMDDTSIVGGFAVSGETFYVKYKGQLFRWKYGESEWFNTGLINMGGFSDNNDDTMNSFKFAVSEETVYVGKHDGHLFQSLNYGSTWKDLTSNMPFRFEHFNDIAFAGSTVYIATNAGVLTSEDGEHWHVITAKTGTHTIIDRMAVVGMNVYGVGNHSVYRLDNRNKWERILPVVPNDIISFVIDGAGFYIATKERGIFHASFEEKQ